MPTNDLYEDVPSREVVEATHEPCIIAKEPYMHDKEPYTHMKEPY